MSQPASAAREPSGNIPLPHSVKQKIKDGVVALALANGCFVRVWAYLLFDGNRYFDNQPVLSVELWALATNILALALLIWLGIRLWRRVQSWAMLLALDLLFVSLLFFPADFVRTQILGWADSYLISVLKSPGVTILAVAFVSVVVWQHRWIARSAAMIIAVTFPVALLTLGKIVLVGGHLMSAGGCAPPPAPPPLSPVRAGQPRVVWIIFDEMDYRVAFERRPPGLELPQFDRLRGGSLSANKAYTPADMTIVSMPALISGRRLLGTFPDGGDLALRLADSGATNDMTAVPTVFSDARKMSVNTGLVGWLIPYSRVLGSNLNYCSWYSMAVYQPAAATTFRGSLEAQITSLAWAFDNRQIFINLCQNSLRDAVSLAGDPSYGLLLFHLPPPHAPGVYLPKQEKFTFMGVSQPQSYLNNLALADHELGVLRQAMESAGQWDKTWIILSADHSWRKSKTYDGIRDYRVPYIIKPPGPTQSSECETQFNTILTRDLIGAILNHQVTNQSSAAAWIGCHANPEMPVAQASTSRD